MREIFSVEIQTDGGARLYIRTPADRDKRDPSVGHELTVGLSSGVNLKTLTPQVLCMIAEAYHAGYICATEDSMEAVSRLTFENSAPRKPAPRISEKRDYRKSPFPVWGRG